MTSRAAPPSQPRRSSPPVRDDDSVESVRVRLFLARLDVDDAARSAFWEVLSIAERRRAQALRGEEDRRRFIADHGLRRRARELAQGLDPGIGPDMGSVIHSSASRAGGLALYAFSDAGEVGVDLEAIPELVESDSPRAGSRSTVTAEEVRRLAARILTDAERAAWRSTAAAERIPALYACWTGKEAHGKALGRGLVFPLSAIEAWSGGRGPVRHEGIETMGVDLQGTAADPACYAASVAVRVPEGTRVAVIGPHPVA